MDENAFSAKERSIAMVEKGETVTPSRCVRVWLGASDSLDEGIWRDSETNELVDMSELWTPGQPNGARLQNCASIWEFVRTQCSISYVM